MDPKAGQDVAGEEDSGAQAESLVQKVKKMTLTERIRFAMKCDKEGRTLLIHDPNRSVQLSLIANPRITHAEVAVLAWSRGSDEEVLRRISEDREWIKYYPVRLGLTCNPKTALSIATKYLSTLMPDDLSKIAKSKDVPVAVAHAARRMILRKY
jgi:hypothetical protein